MGKDVKQMTSGKKERPAIIKFFTDFFDAIAKGDLAVKLSLLFMGAGYFARKQIVKGIIMMVTELVFIDL